MVADRPQSQCTVLVTGVLVAGRCRCPRTGADSKTLRARSPLYHPTRNARTANSRAVVDTYRWIGSPGSTLAWPANPMIAPGAPSFLICQFRSPGREFSVTTNRRADRIAAGRLGGAPLPVQPTPIAPAPTAPAARP